MNELDINTVRENLNIVDGKNAINSVSPSVDNEAVPQTQPEAPTLAVQQQGQTVNPIDLSMETSDTNEVQEPLDDELKQANELREQHINNVAKIASSIFTTSEIEALKHKGPIGFFEAIRRFGTKEALELVPYAGSIMGAASSADVLNIFEKKNRGEVLTTEEENKLNSYIKNMAELELRGGYTNMGAIATGIPEVLGFMAELAASAAITANSAGAAAPAAAASLTKKASSVFAKNVLKREISEKVAQNLAKAAGYSVRSAEIAGVMGARTAENYYNRRMLIEGLTLTDKGEEVFKEANEKPFTTFMKAYGDIFTEVFAEGTGVAISKGINYAASPVGRRIANSIPPAFANKVKALYAKMHPENKWADFIKDKLMYNGFIEELGENRISELMKVGLGVNMDAGSTLEQIQNAVFPGTDEFLVEAGLVGVIGGMSIAGRMVGERLAKAGKSQQEITEALSAMPTKEIERIAEGEVKDITPNFSLEQDKSFGAREFRKGIKQGESLSNSFSVEKTRKELKKAREGNWLLAFKQSFFDRFYLLRSLSPRMNAFVSARNGVAGRAQQAFENYGPTYLTEDGSVVLTDASSYKSILQGMYNEMGNTEDAYNTWQEVGQIERLLWLATKRGNSKVFNKMSEKKAELIDRIGEEEYNAYLRHAKKLSDYFNALQYGEYKEGAIDKDTYIRRKAENDFYWPMRRFFDNSNDMMAPVQAPKFAGKNVSKADMKAKEASLDTEIEVEDLSANVAMLTMASYMNRANQQINRELYEVAKSGVFEDFIRLPREGEDLSDVPAAETVGPKDKLSGPGKVNTFETYIDGEKKTIVVSRTIIPALVDMQPSQTNPLMKMMKVFSGMLRAGATTYNPAFALVNPIKDQFVAFFQTDVGYIPFIDFFGGLRSYITKDDAYVSFMASGASNSGFIQAGNAEDAYKFAEKMAKKSSILNHINIFKWMEELSTATETATRIGVYKRATGGNTLIHESLVSPSQAELRQRELNAYLDHMALKKGVLLYNQVQDRVKKIKEEIVAAKARKDLLDSMTGLPEDAKKKAIAKEELSIDSLSKEGEMIVQLLPEMKKKLDEDFSKLQKWHTAEYLGLEALSKTGWEPKNSAGNTFLYGPKYLFPKEVKPFLDKEELDIAEAAKELKELDELLSNNKKVAIQRMVEKLNQIAPKDEYDLVETLPLKIEIFRASQEEGMDVKEAGDKAGLDYLSAAFLARNATTDFATIGDSMKAINQAIPFTNAQVQAWRLMYQNFKNNWKAATLKTIAGHTVISLSALAWNLFGADDETRKEYQELPTWRKNNFINIKLFGLWWSIPRPFEYGFIFGAIPDRTIESLYMEDKEAARKMLVETGIMLTSSASPIDLGSPLPAGLLPVVESLTNYNFFKQQAIVPGFMQKLEPRYQYRSDTSTTAKKIGDIFNMSPMKLENFINSQFAGAGRDALRLSDYLINLMNREENEAPSKGISGYYALSSIFRGDPIGFRSQSVNTFYDMYDKVEKVQNSYNSLLDKDRTKAYEYRQKHRKELAINSYMRATRSRLQRLSREINRIKEDPRYTGDEKREAIEMYQKRMTEMAALAVKNIHERMSR